MPGIDFFYPEFEVVRRDDRCIRCRVCERQCANEVHLYDPERALMLSDEAKCVNCQRCVSLCPTRALKIVRSDCRLRENANWDGDTIREVYKQAGSGGVLLRFPASVISIPNVRWSGGTNGACAAASASGSALMRCTVMTRSGTC